MVDVTRAMESKYINADLVRDSPTKKCVVVDGGDYVEATYEGKTYEKFELTVEIDGKRKTWSPNKDSCKNIAQDYGRDTKEWIGVIVKLTVSKQAGRDVVIGLPLSKPAHVTIDDVE